MRLRRRESRRAGRPAKTWERPGEVTIRFKRHIPRPWPLRPRPPKPVFPIGAASLNTIEHMDKRLLKRHKRQVARAKENVKTSEPDLRTPEQIKAAREASRATQGSGQGP